VDDGRFGQHGYGLAVEAMTFLTENAARSKDG
jgi:hypothetical protein